MYLDSYAKRQRISVRARYQGVQCTDLSARAPPIMRIKRELHCNRYCPITAMLPGCPQRRHPLSLAEYRQNSSKLTSIPMKGGYYYEKGHLFVQVFPF